MRIPIAVQNLTRELIEYRLALSLGLSAAAGLVLQSLYPINMADPMLRLIAADRPAIYRSLLWSYSLFLYSTPFLVCSILFSLAYVHLYAPDFNQAAGRLPAFPAPALRRDLYLIVGESHHPLKPEPSPVLNGFRSPSAGCTQASW